MPRSTLFPYTTLFRSKGVERAVPTLRQQGRCASVRLLKLEHELVHRPGRTIDREVARVLGVAQEITLRNEVETGRLDLAAERSEEHTSELQSLRHLVCRALHSFPTRRSSDLKAWNAPCPPYDNKGAARQFGFSNLSTNSSTGPVGRLTEKSRASSGWRRKSPSATRLKPAASTSRRRDRKSTRLNSSHLGISYAALYTLSLHDALPI